MTAPTSSPTPTPTPTPAPSTAPTPERDPAREALIRDPGRVDRAPDRPADPDAPGRGLDERDDPIPEPNEPA